METVDRVVQSKEDGKLCLGCLGVDLQGSCSQSFLCLPGSLGSQSFLCLPGSLGSLPLVPESAGQIEEGRKENEAQDEFMSNFARSFGHSPAAMIMNL